MVGRRTTIMAQACTPGPVDAQGSSCKLAHQDRLTRRDDSADLHTKTGRRAGIMVQGYSGGPVDAQGSMRASA
jgi:hypothetical protein